MIAFSSSNRFESVLIVGAGPAGATAARVLALAGVPVRLLDRAVFPRNKPCGGGISMRALRRFPYLRQELPRIATHELARLYLEGPDGQSTVIESDEPPEGSVNVASNIPNPRRRNPDTRVVRTSASTVAISPGASARA